jgi:hypothetical protein
VGDPNHVSCLSTNRSSLHVYLLCQEHGYHDYGNGYFYRMWIWISYGNRYFYLGTGSYHTTTSSFYSIPIVIRLSSISINCHTPPHVSTYHQSNLCCCCCNYLAFITFFKGRLSDPSLQEKEHPTTSKIHAMLDSCPL